MSLGAFHEHLCSGGVLGGALGLEKLSEAVPLSQVEPVAPNSWSMFTFGGEEAVTFAPVPKEASETSIAHQTHTQPLWNFFCPGTPEGKECSPELGCL